MTRYRGRPIFRCSKEHWPAPYCTISKANLVLIPALLDQLAAASGPRVTLGA
jgi:hypothetical protein